MSKIIFIFFLLILIFSPLAFGTVEPWSLTIMESLSFFTLFLLISRNLKEGKMYIYEIPGMIPLLFLIIYIIIQLIPLPPSVVKIISPATYALYKETISFNNVLPWVSLSINKKATLIEFFRITSYIAFYIITIQLLIKKNVLKKTIAVIVVFASFLSLFGILQHILSNNKIYWVRELTMGGTPFGPYVNRNHYAGLMEMLFPLVLGLFFYYKPHVSYKSFREKISEIFNLQKTNIYILLGFSAILIGTSIFLSLSRSGIVCLCLSMIIFGFLIFERGMSRKRGIIIMIIFSLIVLSVGWFGWDPIFERFEKITIEKGSISEQRIQIWKDSFNIIRDFPLTGTGFGSFINIYPRYRTISGNAVADHAHNDYIEIFSDGGIIAFLILLWFFITVLYKSFKTYLKRHEIYSQYIFVGCFTGILSILLHSFTDFNLHIGANGLYFAFLFGLAVSSANTRLREGLNDTYLKRRNIPLKILRPVILLIFVTCLIFNGGVIVGEIYFSKVKNKTLYRMSSEELMFANDRVSRASQFDPLEARYHYALANIERLIANNNIAFRRYKRSIELNPVNGEYLQRLGLILSELKRYDNAERLLKAGIAYDINNPERYKRYGIWLLSIGKKDEGIKIMKHAISLEPQKTRDYITLMVLNGFSDEEIFDALPKRVEPYLLFADYLYNIGRDKMTEKAYLTALQYVKNEPQIKPHYYYKVYRYYIKKGLYNEALKIMRMAIDNIPDNAGIRLTTGKLYEKLKVPYRALEEYRKTLMLDPDNQEAKKRINLITK